MEAECDGVLADALVQRQQTHLRHQAASRQHRGQVNGVERSYRFARERQVVTGPRPRCRWRARPSARTHTATVAHGTTHARLTATAADANATLKAGAGSSLSAVTSGAASAAIALEVGANALSVEVTAEDGTKKTYSVTVTREARASSTNANLSGLSAEAGSDGSWSALDIGTFSATTTQYSATVAHGTTHARLTATAADANATLKAGAGSNLSAVTSGSASAAIALEVGANALSVEVTAENGTKKTYGVRVERSAPPKPLTRRSRTSRTSTTGRPGSPWTCASANRWAPGPQDRPPRRSTGRPAR